MKDRARYSDLENVSTDKLTALFSKYQRQAMVMPNNQILQGKAQLLAQELGVREMLKQIMEDLEKHPETKTIDIEKA